MKTRWVATELCKHFLPPLPLEKQNLKETKNQKNENCNMLSRKMSNHRTKAPPNRSSAPPGFVQNWLTLPGGQTVPLLATLGTGRHWAGRLGSVAPADGRGLGLWAKLQGNRPPARAPSRLPIPGLPLPLPDSSFPSGMRLGPQEVMPASFCKSTGPWLYGDSEARTEYVQNNFFLFKPPSL